MDMLPPDYTSGLLRCQHSSQIYQHPLAQKLLAELFNCPVERLLCQCCECSKVPLLSGRIML